MEDVDTIGNFYEIYGATNVPDGTYTLKVRRIGDTGWKLWRPSSGETSAATGCPARSSCSSTATRR